MKTKRTEKHVINKNHPMFKSIDEYCFKSKNLFNYANYIVRQSFINNNEYINYYTLTSKIKNENVFKEIGSNSGQHTLKMLERCWKSFFISTKDWSKNPSKYLGKPNIPKYKNKDGRYVFIMTNLQSQIKDGYLYFAFKPFKPFNNIIKTKITGKHLQTRCIPNGSNYILEIVYEKEIDVIDKRIQNIIGIDLGLNNFATIQNNIGLKPIVINGKGVKSVNNYYNKKLAKYQSIANKINSTKWTKKLDVLTRKRDNKVEYFLHCASKYIVQYCIQNNIDTVVIGYNKKWKQDIKLGNSTQKFVYIPYDKFIKKLTYKLEEHGINLFKTEESYTSKASFIDFDEMKKDIKFKGKRISRGLYQTNSGILLNADVNGASNIIRKVFPNVFSNGIKGVDFHPIIINVG